MQQASKGSDLLHRSLLLRSWRTISGILYGRKLVHLDRTLITARACHVDLQTIEARLEQIRVALNLDAAAMERWRAALRRTPNCVTRRARLAPLESRRSTQPGNV